MDLSIEQARSTGRLYLLLWVAALFTALCIRPSAAADPSEQSSGGRSYKWSEYQHKILLRTEPIWPRKYHHIYTHYNGSFIEERFFKAWLEAGRELPQIYLPIGWSTYFWSHRRVKPMNHTIADEARDRVQTLLDSLDKRLSYFTITHFAELLAEERIIVPCDLKLTLFSGGGPQDGVWAPHLTLIPIPLLSQILEPGTGPRTRKVTFAGGFSKWQDFAGIRTMLRKKLNEYPGFNVTRKVEDWKQFIQDSEFHLCPRGYGPTSYRLYECLQSETIPIYVWAKETWMAFSDQLDWNSISLMIHFSKISKLPEIVNQTNIEDMRANIRATRHMWTYEYTIDYIMGRIANTSSDPSLTEYRRNGTDCTGDVGLEEESKRRRSEQLDALSQQLGSVGTPVAAVAGPEEASVAGPAEAARTPMTSVSVVVLLAALALLWHRRAFLRRRCRELQHAA